MLIKPSIIFAGIILLASGLRVFPRPAEVRLVTVNRISLEHARKLIAEGHFVNDKHGDWAAHHPSARDQNIFMQKHGSEEYSRWYLGVDESHRVGGKARYKFPFGDFQNVHRCALLAAQNRARQYRYSEIENAARELLALIEEKGSVAAIEIDPPNRQPILTGAIFTRPTGQERVN